MNTNPPATEDAQTPAEQAGGDDSAATGTKKTRKDGKPKATKATAAEISKRVEELLRLKLDGAQFHDIVQYASEKGWGVVDRQLCEYMRRADDLLRERQEKSRSRLLAYHRAARRALYARSLQSADFRTALAVLDSEAKLTGLFDDTKKLEHLAATLLAKVADLEAAANAHRADRPTTLPASRDPAGGQADRGDSGEPVSAPPP